MQDVPGTLRSGGVPFGTTHWSVIAEAGECDSSAQAALTQLCRNYWPPLYSCVRRRGYNRDDAQDLVQGFFAQFLGHKAYAQTDRRKGKFRTFLIASLKHYMADVWDRERARKRGGDLEFVLLDEDIQEAETRWAHEASGAMMNEDRQYEQGWAAALVERALRRLSADYATESKREVFAALKPFLCGGAGLPTQEQIAADLRMPIETLRSHLSRLRARYRELLRDEVTRTVSEADDVDAELRHLCEILTVGC
ncbi:MAG: RNA polymerase sigma factor [Verrucomicrobiota bacterium]|nr:RNA polymerase sigma factor [Verrucomicrobiota bacterium]